jgi:lipoyl(octanoyl) transferase
VEGDVSLDAWRLGRVEYADGLELQRQFQEARKEERAPDTLLLLEHPAVLTMGRAAKASNIVAPPAQLEALGVNVFETDRGGDVTYHGPGQLVGYPLLFLPPGQQDVRRYVRRIEEVILRTTADFGVTSERIEQWPGVWVRESRQGGPRKICALGVHLSRWYTRHGFALNVQPQLAHFELIVPCGIREAGVTSLAAELGAAPAFAEVEARVLHHFSEVFEAALRVRDFDFRSVSVTVTRDDGRVLLLERSPARGGFWQTVTGSVEPGEAADQTAQRELAEETGLEMVPRPLDYVHAFARGDARSPCVTQETAFVARVPQGATVRLSDEHQRFEWVTPAEALARLPFAGLREAVRRSATT